MAGPNLPTSLTGSPHPAGHNTIHSYINKLDTTFLTPSDNNVLTYDNASGTYKPEAPAAGGSGGAVFLQVASNDAPADVKAKADYICNGSADQDEINLAIDRAAPLQSRNAGMPAGAEQLGRVVLSGGRFTITAPILMRTGVHLQGSGFVTELMASSNTGTGIIKLAAVDDHLTEVSHMYLNGNSSSGGSCDGINYDMTGSGNTSDYPDTNPDSYHYIHDLYLDQFTGTSRSTSGGSAIKLWASGTANNRGNIIDRVQIRDCDAHGIELTSASDSFISNCHVGGCNYAYRIATGNMKVANCKSFFSVTAGFYATSGRGTLVGFESQDDQTGIYLDAEPWTCAGITVDGAGTDGIRIGSSEMVIAGFSIFMRNASQFTTMTNGLNIDAAHTSLNLTGTITSDSPDAASHITNPVTGTPGANCFIRVAIDKDSGDSFYEESNVPTAQTGSFTITQGMRDQDVRCNSASTITVTVPVLLAGTEVRLIRMGAGAVNLSASSTTIRVPAAGSGSPTAQYSSIRLLWVTTSEVIVSGAHA